MSKKHKRRSVGIQSTDVYDHEFNQPGRLKKKTGFRDLLHNSVLIAPPETEEVNESFHGGQKSKGVQATGAVFQKQSSNFSNIRRLTSALNDSRHTTSDMVNVIDRDPFTSTPGPSKRISRAQSSMSFLSQRNDLRHKDESLALVYNYGSKPSSNSMRSSLSFYYASQGSRRFSDETVLLIEDYQSYDQANIARRQESEVNRLSGVACCAKNTTVSTEVLTKPLPIVAEQLGDSDEYVCRICHEGEDAEQLIEPCLCKGSVGCVHASCLKEWLEQSNHNRCELCNYPYAIRQSKKYSKCYSIKVFYSTIVDRRTLAYDVISFVVITPLTLVGVVMCIQASIYTGGSKTEPGFQMGYITRIGMMMLTATILVSYVVWMYTLISFHFKSWRKWYAHCYDVEVLPVKMTSEEKLEARKRLNEEIARGRQSRGHNSTVVSVVSSAQNLSYYPPRVSAIPVAQASG